MKANTVLDSSLVAGNEATSKGDRSASVNEVEHQATRPPPRRSDATVDVDEIRFHRKQQP